jgi:hypothetical protein
MGINIDATTLGIGFIVLYCVPLLLIILAGILFAFIRGSKMNSRYYWLCGVLALIALLIFAYAVL